MFVRSMIIDTVASYKHLASYNIESGWVSVVGGELMRWKAFSKTMFDWRQAGRLSKILEFPLETIIYIIGMVVLAILIKWFVGGYERYYKPPDTFRYSIC